MPNIIYPAPGIYNQAADWSHSQSDAPGQPVLHTPTRHRIMQQSIDLSSFSLVSFVLFRVEQN